MRIILKLQEDHLINLSERGRKLTFPISWEHNQEYYPFDTWDDFGVTIIGWWTNAMINVLRGAHREQFLFMDGAYWGNLTSLSDTMCSMTLNRRDVTWEFPVSDFVSQIMAASKNVSSVLERLHIKGDDRRDLERGVEALVTAMKSKGQDFAEKA